MAYYLQQQYTARKELFLLAINRTASRRWQSHMLLIQAHTRIIDLLKMEIFIRGLHALHKVSRPRHTNDLTFTSAPAPIIYYRVASIYPIIIDIVVEWKCSWSVHTYEVYDICIQTTRMTSLLQQQQYLSIIILSRNLRRLSAV